MGGIPHPSASRALRLGVYRAQRRRAMTAYVDRTAERAVDWAYEAGLCFTDWAGAPEIFRFSIRTYVGQQLAIQHAQTMEPMP